MSGIGLSLTSPNRLDVATCPDQSSHSAPTKQELSHLLKVNQDLLLAFEEEIKTLNSRVKCLEKRNVSQEQILSNGVQALDQLEDRTDLLNAQLATCFDNAERLTAQIDSFSVDEELFIQGENENVQELQRQIEAQNGNQNDAIQHIADLLVSVTAHNKSQEHMNAVADRIAQLATTIGQERANQIAAILAEASRQSENQNSERSQYSELLRQQIEDLYKSFQALQEGQSLQASTITQFISDCSSQETSLSPSNTSETTLFSTPSIEYDEPVSSCTWQCIWDTILQALGICAKATVTIGNAYLATNTLVSGGINPSTIAMAAPSLYTSASSATDMVNGNFAVKTIEVLGTAAGVAFATQKTSETTPSTHKVSGKPTSKPRDDWWRPRPEDFWKPRPWPRPDEPLWRPKRDIIIPIKPIELGVQNDAEKQTKNASAVTQVGSLTTVLPSLIRIPALPPMPPMPPIPPLPPIPGPEMPALRPPYRGKGTGPNKLFYPENDRYTLA